MSCPPMNSVMKSCSLAYTPFVSGPTISFRNNRPLASHPSTPVKQCETDQSQNPEAELTSESKTLDFLYGQVESSPRFNDAVPLWRLVIGRLRPELDKK